MDKHYTYLLINFLTIFFPLILSFDKKVRFYTNWKYIFPGLLITGVVFLVWDYVFTLYDVWSFNNDYVVGIWFLDLPLEEILFFITVPFACLFIYECLNAYVKPDILGKVARDITWVFLILSVVLLGFFFDRVYTLITFGLLALMCIYVLFKGEQKAGRFYLAYFVSLLPFYIVNGLLTSIPVVLYNNSENMGLRVGTIPFEDHFYSLAMLLMNMLFFEYFRAKKLKDA
ncbi:lycopene cyclase domain-containing protein [Desertivirga arenae]|uniref:lycopene cyclase domain-containing protein n=1 Tax=Desertivirga arenae TaxID=2810309 RepID=UPI001A977BD4|nr:lycopene cyclase domain-containing protein [Pedobacter sp. SYSU D00823]